MFEKYTVIGLRICADDEHYEIGDTCRRSYEWDYENDCSTYNTDNPIKLSGTCAVIIKTEDMTDAQIIANAKEMARNYAGEQTIIIGGYDYEYGSDENEIIINQAEVLAVI